MTDWKRLVHAHGPATRVPAQIAALSSKKAPEREEAYRVLFNTLVAPGKWFSSSAPALEALGVSFGASGPHRALWLAGDIVAGDHLFWVATEARTKKASAEKRAVDEVATTLVPKATKLLDAKKPEHRAAALFFLAFVPSAAGDFAEAAKRILAKDKSDEARVSAALALGARAKAGDASAKAALEATSAKGPLAGAVAVAKRIGGISVPDDEYARAVAAWVTASLEPEASPWGRGGAAEKVAGAATTEAKRKTLAPELLAAVAEVPEVPTPRRRAVVHAALDWAGFTSRWGQYDVADPRDLDEPQRRTAEMVTRFSDIAPVMGSGLPSGADTIRRWLALDPPSALERPAGKGREPRWLVLRKLVTQKKQPKPASVIETAVDGLSLADQLDVLSLLAQGAYRISGEGNLTLQAKDLIDRAARGEEREVEAWARQLLDRALDVEGAARPWPRSAPVMAALHVLAKSGEPIDPRYDALIGFNPPDIARAILERIPGERRKRIGLGWAQGAQPAGYGIVARNLVSLYDLVGSKDLAAAIRPWYRDTFFKNDPAGKQLLPMLDGGDKR